jgi:hypothetical protein
MLGPIGLVPEVIPLGMALGCSQGTLKVQMSVGRMSAGRIVQGIVQVIDSRCGGKGAG